LTNLRKSFGEVSVLHGIDLTVGRGEIHALVGHNGSGKSTLVKCLSGYYRPEPGATVVIGGQDLVLGSAAAMERAGARFIHQDLGLVGDLNAVDNISLAVGYQHGRSGRIDWRNTTRRSQELVDELGYDFDVNRPVRTLSLAQRTGVAIARALATRPHAPATLLVLDEPTANLDSLGAQHLFEVLDRLRGRGIGTLFITHHLDEVMQRCDTVTVLRDGAVVDNRPVRAIPHVDDLVDMMLGSTAPAPTPLDAAVTNHPLGEVSLRISDLSTGALRSLAVEVRAGEIVGLAGLAGSGRDEVALAAFGGHTRQGSIQVAGRNVASRPNASIRAGVALIPAKRHEQALIPAIDAAANLTAVAPPSRVGRLDRKRERGIAEEWTRRLGIVGPSVRGTMSQLSGGNQQKVVLARWLRMNPRVLIMDEPTQGVDVTSAATIHDEVREAAASGCAVLISSSDAEELAALCHRVLVLRRGRVSAELTGGGLSRDNIDKHMLQETT
jgi:ribose transport system ATP-binding protein